MQDLPLDFWFDSSIWSLFLCSPCRSGSSSSSSFPLFLISNSSTILTSTLSWWEALGGFLIKNSERIAIAPNTIENTVQVLPTP